MIDHLKFDAEDIFAGANKIARAFSKYAGQCGLKDESLVTWDGGHPSPRLERASHKAEFRIEARTAIIDISKEEILRFPGRMGADFTMNSVRLIAMSLVQPSLKTRK